MGKKRNRKQYISKGQRRNQTPMAGLRDAADKAMDKIKAWKAGKNPWITVVNREKNRPFIKVRANDCWGNPKEARANLFKGS